MSRSSWRGSEKSEAGPPNYPTCAAEVLSRWIFFADQGEFRTGDYQEIMNKASCLSLVSNAILVWNTLQIAKIVESLRQAGAPVADEDLARISPLMHRHVIPNGTYHFSPAYRGGPFVVEYATVSFRRDEGFGPVDARRPQ